MPATRMLSGTTENKTAKSSDCPDRAPHLRADAHRNPDNVRPGHELAKANNVSKFPVGYPAAVLDRYAARPDNSSAATDTAERDCKERGEGSSEMDSLRHLLRLLRVGHL